MRIVHVNKRYGYEGGIEQYLHWVSEELTRRGHEVWFICSELEAGTNYVESARVIQIPQLTEHTDTPHAEASALLTAALRRIDPDVIYLHHLANPFLIQAMVDQAPVVRFAHMEDTICPQIEKSFRPDYRPCTYRAGPIACGVLCSYVHRYGSRHPGTILDRLKFQAALRSENHKITEWVVASGFMKRSLLRERYADEKVNLIPYFTQLPEESSGSTTGADVPYIFFSGRMVEAKGVDHLLRAFARLSGNVRLKLAGDGKEVETLRMLAEKLGVSDRVEFLGRIRNEDLGRHRNGAALVAVPSVFQEPFGIVGIEAMANSIPVVAHDVGGISQWLANGETGFLVPAKDVPALAEKMNELLQSRELRRKMGEEGRRRVESQFLATHHLSKLEEVLRRVTN